MYASFGVCCHSSCTGKYSELSYRLNGDFNDGTFSSGNQTTIQYWKKNSESSSIYTMVSEGKKILKFAIAGTLETSLFLPAGNYTLRMNVPAFRRSGSLGTVGGEDMGFWVRVKRGSEYLDRTCRMECPMACLFRNRL